MWTDEHIYEHGANPKVRLIELEITESVLAGVNIGRMIEEDRTDDWKAKFPGPRTEQLEKVDRNIYGSSFTGFRETLRHGIDIGRFQPPGEQSPDMNLGIVSHGLTLRVFMMSLLMHRTKEELKEFGLTDEMLADHEWQKHAEPGEVNYDCRITGASYFRDEENKTSSKINLKSELSEVPG
ncbi:uncharacterized protein [Primulina huaijiensis]|uniref:uncharacterized protein n=1 Tax=Primulina huaijiensis TaxID=1492673 RepID=UPI003CC6F778